MSTHPQMPWAERSQDPLVSVGPHARVGVVGELRVVFVAGMPVLRLNAEDLLGLRAHLASLESAQVVSQSLVARSGLVPEATFHRDCVAFRQGGIAAVLERGIRGSKGPRKVTVDVVAQIEEQRGAGLTYLAIATLLGLSEKAVRLALRGQDPLQPPSPFPLLGVTVANERVAQDKAQMQGKGIETKASACEGAEASVAALSPESSKTAASGLCATPPPPPPRAAPIVGMDAQQQEEEQSEASAVEQSLARVEQQEPRSECADRIASQRALELLLARLGQIEEQSALFPPVHKTKFAGPCWPWRC